MNINSFMVMNKIILYLYLKSYIQGQLLLGPFDCFRRQPIPLCYHFYSSYILNDSAIFYIHVDFGPVSIEAFDGWV